jgi:hypothetical protein
MTYHLPPIALAVAQAPIKLPAVEKVTDAAAKLLKVPRVKLAPE